MLFHFSDNRISAIATASALGSVAFLFLLCGCNEAPQITTQRVPKAQTGFDSFRNEVAAEDEPKSSFPVPDGWTRGKASPMFPMDKFLKTVDGKEVVLSVMSLPASNEWGSNVQRWMGQVGMAPSSNPIDKLTSEVDVDGIASSKVRLFTDEEDSKAIVGIMSVKGNLAWFIKLMGDKSAVEKTESDFDQYVKSIKLP